MEKILAFWKKLSLWIKVPLIGVTVLCVGGIGFAYYFLQNQPRAEFWEGAIATYEKNDMVSPPEEGQILFVGSSTIRFWRSLEQDMAPLKVINRGFGGSNLEHSTHYADRIITPYRPRAIVLYAGDNDFSGLSPKTPEAVSEDFQDFVHEIRRTLSSTPIFYVSIKPSKLRWKNWPEMAIANELIADYAMRTEGVYFIDIASGMLSSSGELRDELFAVDGVHLNKSGYEVWTEIIRPALIAELEG